MRSRKWSLFMVALGLACATALAAAQPVGAPPFESNSWSTPENSVDVQVEATLRQHGAHLRRRVRMRCSFAASTWISSARCPQPAEVEAFLADQTSRQTRRAD